MGYSQKSNAKSNLHNEMQFIAAVYPYVEIYIMLIYFH